MPKLSLVEALASVRADPIGAVKTSFVAQYPGKPLACLLVLTGLFTILLHSGIAVSGLVAKNHAWALLGRGVAGILIGLVPLLFGSSVAKISIKRAGHTR